MSNSIALSLLLGFELSYYLLIVQTGLVAHYGSNLIALFPMFMGGVLGTVLVGKNWIIFNKPILKVVFALTLQLMLSFLYPKYNIFTLFLLGISVGMMAPLGIYLFKINQQTELLVSLAIAYSVGTYFFTSDIENRFFMSIALTSVALISAIVLRNYDVDVESKNRSHTFKAYLPLILWIFLDSNLFETISRHIGLDIWSEYTVLIISCHLIGLVIANRLKLKIQTQHKVIAFLFFVSYLFSYLEFSFFMAIVYPFTISYYNMVVFRTLSQEVSLSKLSFIMIFVGWLASGLGLSLALSNLLH